MPYDRSSSCFIVYVKTMSSLLLTGHLLCICIVVCISIFFHIQECYVLFLVDLSIACHYHTRGSCLGHVVILINYSY